jgi:hypothetical protein
MLAPMDVYYPDVKPSDQYDESTLRASLRSDGKSGFLFICNHVRLKRRLAISDARIDVELDDRKIEVYLDVPEDSTFILPVGMTYGTLETDYVTAMPLDIKDGAFVFARIEGLSPEVITDGKRYGLENGENVIEGVRFFLEEPVHYSPTVLERAKVTEQTSTVSTDILLSHLGIEDKTTEYKIEWKKGSTYVVVKAFGNVAGFFVNGNLVNDFYLYNRDGAPDSFVIDVRSYDVNEGVLKIQPFCENDIGTVYMDGEIKLGSILPEVYCTDNDVLKI